jgi:hypothetical protein
MEACWTRGVPEVNRELRDENGIQIKEAHNGHRGPQIGRKIYILRRHQDTVWGPFDSRHDAIGYYVVNLKHHNKLDWFDIERIPIGSFRFDDWRIVER